MVKKSGFISDYRASEDGLDFSIFKPALLNILQTADTPLTVGVFGTWGSGKTTLLNMLKDELDNQKSPSLKTVWFTAWKYEQHDALWRAFMLRVVDSLHPRKADGTRYQPEDFKEDAEKAEREKLEHLGRLERSIYETVNWQDEGQWSLNTGELLKQGSKLPIWLAFHLTGLGSAAKDLGLNPDLAQLLEREVREHHLNQLNYMEQFAEEFQKAIQLVLGNDGRLVVFVDDLDRCLPEKAIEVLEAIKLFLDVPGTVFVLGMDREVVRRGIEAHYGALLKTSSEDEMPINGDVYLQKIIQIPFNLPPLDMKAREKFIQNLETDLPADYHLDEMTREAFARGMYPNPRQVKRALNVFFLLKQVAQEQEKRALIPKDFLAFPLLAKTVLIQSQWPELYKLWRQYPTLIQTLEDEYTRQPVSEDELLRGLNVEETPGEKVQPSAGNADREASLRPARRPAASGLMAPFLNDRQKYALLAELLRYPLEAGKGSQRARFGGLTRSEVQVYVGLVGAFEPDTVDGAPPPLQLSEDWARELESGDLAKIREVLAALKEREPDTQGPQHRMAQNHLVSLAQNSEFPPTSRANAADVADELGFAPQDVFDFVEIGTGLTRFSIGKYPVTNAQYARFLQPENFADRSLWEGFPKLAEPEENYKPIGNWGSQAWDWLQGQKKENGVLLPRYWQDARFGARRTNAPVVGISWYEANAYCRWLWTHWEKLEEGQRGLARPAQLRLPTEAEWIAAAGGDEKGRFAFGELGTPSQEISRYANTSESQINRTTPVWMYPQGASPREVMDLSGNVWEWLANYRDKDHDVLSLRGGSWNFNLGRARVSVRYNGNPHLRDYFIGFRILALPS
ncbi:P-loop NTPase fold protein [Levilinea saccharolytica]|uniref:Sulfatase-modifying factor enzyme domain-containing protein n=1 Tax=Levilinea saccharolytica TaxID=229921 RepID=A0A0N8GPE6_9CHLR|nr:P-loop NTPase fold protein [Levilinea saccharolytica]KPL80682.1 hypothetical protein ADN01_11125 [Levilinea saccharolytica]GAP17260.1 uncharacterized conserved protein [Levilinea saccharolytica]